MQTYPLRSYSSLEPRSIASVWARISFKSENWLTLRWDIEGSEHLVVPSFAGRGQADELWRTTCFELFVQTKGESAYGEYNFSPSERWAAYRFEGYRSGMKHRPMLRDPVCTMRRGRNQAIFDAAISFSDLPPMPWRFGLCAVLEEAGRHFSYWALAHPEAGPDFHHPDCFALSLAAPDRE